MMTPSFTILAFMLLVYGSMATTLNPDQEAELLGKGQVPPGLPTAVRKETISATTLEKIGLAVAGQAALKSPASMSQMHINPAGELSEVFDPKRDLAEEWEEKAAEHKERKMRQQKRQGHLEISPMGEVVKASILLEDHAQHSSLRNTGNTTDTAEECLYKISVSRSDAGLDKEAMVVYVTSFKGDTFKFDGCTTDATIAKHAADCTGKYKVAAGVITMKNSKGDVMAGGNCCNLVNEILDTKMESCTEVKEEKVESRRRKSKGTADDLKGTADDLKGTADDLKSKIPALKTDAHRSPFPIWVLAVPVYVAWTCTQE